MDVRADTAIEVVVRLEDATLDVRFLRAGERFCAGPTPDADLAWPRAIELLRVGRDGRVVRPEGARALDGDGFELALGALRVRVRPTTPPPRDALSPRFAWPLGVALLPLLFTSAALGMGAGPSRRASLAIDPRLARLAHVELEMPRRPPPPRVSTRRTRAASQPAHVDPFVAGQAWVGTYFCPQGETELTLRIERVDGDRIEAVFDFDFDHGAAAGKFGMHGRFSRSTGEVRLVADTWIDHPRDYYSVGLRGSTDGTRYTGDVEGPGCGAFSLRLHDPSR